MWKQGDSNAEKHGAGAILFSKLCSYGFSLPLTAITDQDEKVLFDLEVKLKLKHASARNLLWTVVADFPPSVLLQRQELLVTLLNGIGSPFSHEDVLTDPLGLHAIGFLRIFLLLLSRVRSEVGVLLDGGLLSNTTNLQEKQTEECGRKQGVNLLQTRHYSHCSDVLDGDLASVRYPSLRLGDSICSASVSGLAFAVLAAALPLLQSRSVVVMQSLGDVARVTLDLAFDPSCDRQDMAHDANTLRARHLVGRLEQLAQALSLSSFLSAGRDCFTEGLRAEEVADRCFLCSFARLGSDILHVLRRILGDSLVLPVCCSQLETCRSFPDDDAAVCRMPMLPAAAMHSCFDQVKSHATLRCLLETLTLCVKFNLLEKDFGEKGAFQLLQQLTDLLEATPTARAEQESYLLCLSSTLRLMSQFPSGCCDPRQIHLHLQVLRSTLGSVNRAITHTLSCAHQVADGSLAVVEESFLRGLYLHAISLFRYLVAAVPVEEVENEYRNLLQHLIVRVLLDETCHIECRLGLLQAVEDMLINQPHVVLLNCICQNVLGRSFSKDRTLSAGIETEASSQLDALLQVYVRLAKVIALPDSFARTAILSFCLKAIHIIVHLDGFMGADVSALSDWIWLLRYLYDHRSAFKSLALQIFARLLVITNRGNDGVASSWPSCEDQLLEAAYHVAIDRHESHAVRAHALYLSVLLLFSSENGPRKSQSTECSVSLRRLVDAMGELLARRSDGMLSKIGFASVTVTSAVLLCVSRALCILCRDSAAQQLVHLHRIVPLMIERLNLHGHLVNKQHQVALGLQADEDEGCRNFCPQYLKDLLKLRREDNFLCAGHIYAYLLQLCDYQPQWVEDSARFGNLMLHISTDTVNLLVNECERSYAVSEEMFLSRLVALFSLLYRLHHLSHDSEQVLRKAPSSIYNDTCRLLSRAMELVSDRCLKGTDILQRQVLQAGGRWVAFVIQSVDDAQPLVETATLSRLVEVLLLYRVRILKQFAVVAGSGIINVLGDDEDTEVDISAFQVDVLVTLILQKHPALLHNLTSRSPNQAILPLLQYFLQTVKECGCNATKKIASPHVMSGSFSGSDTVACSNRISQGTGSRITSKWRNNSRSYGMSARVVNNSDSTSSSCPIRSCTKSEQSVLELMSDRARCRAAGALLVLQSMQPILPLMLAKRDLGDLMQSIYVIQRESVMSSLTIHTTSQACQECPQNCMSVRPSQLAALVLVSAAMLVRQDVCMRSAYIGAASKSHFAYLQQSKATSQASLLHWLLNLGLSSGQMPSFSRLALHLTAELLPLMLPNTAEKLESLLPGVMQTASGLRYQITLLLTQYIEKSLQASADSHCDIHFALLPFFAALAHGEAGPCCYDKADPTVLPLPDLVASLCNTSSSLGSAVSRGLGSVALWQTYSLDMSLTLKGNQLENEENISASSLPITKYILHEKVFRALTNQSSRESSVAVKTGGLQAPQSPISLTWASMCVRLLSHRSEKVRSQLNSVRSDRHAQSIEARQW